MIRSQKQSIEYLSDNDNRCCPNCHGKDISTQQIVEREGDDGIELPPDIFDEWQCFDCGEKWLEGFEIVLCVRVIKKD